MSLYLGTALFLGGLLISFGSLLVFERRLRKNGALRHTTSLDRRSVGATLRVLLGSGVVSGVGMGVLGMTAFLGGQSGPPGPAACVGAGVFLVITGLGWALILTAGFLVRVDGLERRIQRR